MSFLVIVGGISLTWVGIGALITPAYIYFAKKNANEPPSWHCLFLPILGPILIQGLTEQIARWQWINAMKIQKKDKK